MSNWTHVAGIVRIDDVRIYCNDGDEEQYLRSIFGKELHYDSPSEAWADANENTIDYLPMGSEGSLTLSVWVNPKANCLAAYTVSVFGDLRDHDDPNAIIDWFKEKCISNNLWIRNAVITARNELKGTANWVYTEEEGE